MGLTEDVICSDKIDPKIIRDLLYTILKHSCRAFRYFNREDNGYDDFG